MQISKIIEASRYVERCANGQITLGACEVALRSMAKDFRAKSAAISKMVLTQ